MNGVDKAEESNHKSVRTKHMSLKETLQNRTSYLIGKGSLNTSKGSIE